ncbi:c-type cytochrome [Roseibacillus ishigakijimensis]|uniref:Cytochrome c n=1 Tax=Roseibacillus ishigakijimensis TaxID=454146 RepID=A0A934RSL6_9BACT|nr:cytochrome c [Roseibacillus ishigakijimensis]MBK1834896.1 cytochrome c [Roseibacillus ishigakijimensis]
MLKYFFIVYAFVALAVVGIFGIPGTKFERPPFRLFPDMDEQDKLKGQQASDFFADGRGARLPAPGTIPNSGDNGEFSVEFGEGRTGYYYTGHLEGYYGTGMPEELALTADNAAAFLARGEERYGIYCAICHGESGDGEGVVKQLGLSTVRNLHDTGAAGFDAENYPDGRLFEVISKGKGQMGAYGMNIPVEDRWAIVAFVRALQEAREVSKEELAQKEEGQ